MNNPEQPEAVANIPKTHAEEVAALKAVHDKEILDIHAAYFELIKTIADMMSNVLSHNKIEQQQAQIEEVMKLTDAAKNLAPNAITKTLMRTGKLPDEVIRKSKK